MNAKQFKVFLMNSNGLIERLVNCDDIMSARCIAEGIYSDMRAIEIIEVV